MNPAGQQATDHRVWWKAIGLSVAIVLLPFVFMAIYTVLFVSCPHCKRAAWQFLPVAPGIVPGFLFQMHVTHLRTEWAFWITSVVFGLLMLGGLSFFIRRGGRWRVAAIITMLFTASLFAVAALAIIRA